MKVVKVWKWSALLTVLIVGIAAFLVVQDGLEAQLGVVVIALLAVASLALHAVAHPG